MRLFLSLAFVGFVVVGTARADEKPTPKSRQQITVYLLNSMPAEKAAARLENELLKTVKPKTGGAGIVPRSPVTIIPDSKTNSLLVVSAPELSRTVRWAIGELEWPKSRDSILPFTLSQPYWEVIESLNLSMIIESRRRRSAIDVLTDEEVRIFDSLQKPVSFQFQRVTLRTAIKHIATKADINIVMDQKGLRDAGVSLKTPVTFSIRQIPLRSALKQLLGKLQLSFDIEQEVLKITSRRRLHTGYFLKVYPVADLVAGVKDGKAVIDFDSLIRRIQSDIAPGTWKDGKGEVRRIESHLSLAIRQTREGHNRVGKLIQKIRGERRAAYRLQTIGD